ncbi:MAG: hypothetical protein AB8I08_32835 [Sandaracinaceae bacterium]
MRRMAMAVGIVTLLTGCLQEIRIDDPDGSPPPFDAGPAPDAGFVPPAGKCTEATAVDLLFMVDNSNSTTEEQASLTAELPALVSSLIAPPDDDGDGEPDWLPVLDLRVGVITTDMGTGGATVPTCARSDFGDDGVLLTRAGDRPGCAASYPAPFAFDPAGGVTAEAFAAEVACVAGVGTGGCGFEQPLEAILKALSPGAPTAYTASDYVPPEFFRGSLPHGDLTNAGFVRADSLLMVVALTDEEDCSAADPDLFNPTSVTYGATDLNLRCFRHADEALHPVSRYVQGLTALRAQRPDLFAFALIAGVPTDLTVPIQTAPNFDDILSDPRMEERIDPEMPTRLIPSCDTPGRGIAFPPRRLVEVARGLGPARSTVQSICASDFGPTRDAIARLIGRRACSTFQE